MIWGGSVVADLMRDAAVWLADKLNRNAAESVVYSRGASSVTVKATVGEQPLRLTDEYGVRIEFGNVDFCIDAAAIDFGDGPTEPAPGDQIRRTAGNVVPVYEVMAPQGEPVWRPADSYGIKLRIHSKQVGTE
jgi:hypothetical protein